MGSFHLFSRGAAWAALLEIVKILFTLHAPIRGAAYSIIPAVVVTIVVIPGATAAAILIAVLVIAGTTAWAVVEVILASTTTAAGGGSFKFRCCGIANEKRQQHRQGKG